MKKIIAFDLHGTLAESRTKVDSGMASLLLQLLKKKEVAIISGSTLGQIEDELLSSLDGAGGLLGRLYLCPSEGGEMHRWDGGWVEVYAVKLSPEEKVQIIQAFRSICREVDFLPDKTFGETLLDRGSQVVFAALGLDAPLAAKKVWDLDARKRLVLKYKLSKKLPDFEITIGGYTSITVSRRGVDKAYGVARLLNYLGCQLDEMLYVGDGFFEGGDDFPVKAMGVECVEVKSPEDTRKVIRRLLDGGA